MSTDKPPFSYPVKVGHIAANPVTVTLEAEPREREALARLWQVEAVKALTAELQLSRWKRDGVRVKGALRARIVQSCVVTLEPVESEIAETFEQVFVPEGSKLARAVGDEAAEMLLDPEGPDLPEVFSGDEIDVAALVAEFAALAIDPYPRKPGVAFSGPATGDDVPAGRPGPFAALKNWKKD